ncbi:MAG: hypothetical protein ACHQZQ_01155 [SAR324 cluster bacterium]
MHRAGRRWIAIAPDGFTERRPVGLELSPHPRSPIVWRFRDGDLHGSLLNVAGWLEGGLVSVSTRGTLYVRTVGGEARALYLPGPAVHVDLGPKPPRTLAAGERNTPLFPDTWPKTAVRQVIRRRLRTVIVLAEDTLLAELDGKTPP